MRPDMISRGFSLMLGGLTAQSRGGVQPPQNMAFNEPRLVQRLMTVTTASISILLVWASVAQLDDIARAGGVLVAHGNNAVVQHPSGGTLQQIYVHEGQRVEAGQPLIRLNDTDIEADSATIRQRMDFLGAQVARLGYVLGLPQQIPASMSASAAIPQSNLLPATDVSTVLQPVAQNTESSATIIPQVAALLPPPDVATLANLAAYALIEPAAGELPPNNDPQAVALMERRRTLRQGLALAQSEYQRQVNLRQQGYSTQSRVYVAERDMQSQSQSLAAFEAELAAQYASAMSEYYQQDEQLKKLVSRAENTVLRAPTAGIVQSLRLNTTGASVPAGVTLMELVPSDAPLEALLRLSPNHIGMVRVGQTANIRITAFESSHYGTLTGTVTRISADAITDAEGRPAYQVWVHVPQTLQGARGKQQLKPGMVLVAAVVTGRHSIMDYLLRPIRNALDDLAPHTPSAG